MNHSAIAKVGVIVCSTRQPRVCPQIVDFVVDTIHATRSKPASHGTAATTTTTIPTEPEPTINVIDLQDHQLPLFDEPGIPSQIHDAAEYAHAHTRAWSATVRAHAAFIFVVPQYNWGYPAAIKNAIDYLCHEWKGKPAVIVSYGGHGGGLCNAQLRQVLTGIGMRLARRGVELTFPNRELLVKAVKGERMGLDGAADQGVWSDEREKIAAAYAELLELMSTDATSSS